MSQKNFTTKALAVMEAAQQAAAMRYNQEITSAHVLLALAKEPEGLLATIFEECNTDLPMLKARVEKELSNIPSVKGTDRLSMGPDMVRVIGLDVSACHRLLPEDWEQESRFEGVLLLAEPPHQGRLQATYWLDGRQGKRALWQQLCCSGWLKSEPIDADY